MRLLGCPAAPAAPAAAPLPIAPSCPGPPGALMPRSSSAARSGPAVSLLPDAAAAAATAAAALLPLPAIPAGRPSLLAMPRLYGCCCCCCCCRIGLPGTALGFLFGPAAAAACGGIGGRPEPRCPAESLAVHCCCCAEVAAGWTRPAKMLLLFSRGSAPCSSSGSAKLHMSLIIVGKKGSNSCCCCCCSCCWPLKPPLPPRDNRCCCWEPANCRAAAGFAKASLASLVASSSCGTAAQTSVTRFPEINSSYRTACSWSLLASVSVPQLVCMTVHMRPQSVLHCSQLMCTQPFCHPL